MSIECHEKSYQSISLRLGELVAFVRDPVQLRVLRGRPGGTLKEKLRQKVSPCEHKWYKFLHRTSFSLAQEEVISRLNEDVNVGIQDVREQKRRRTIGR